MTVLYRALFSADFDDQTDYLKLARALFASWAAENPEGISLEDGTTVVQLNRNPRPDGAAQGRSVKRKITLRTVGGTSPSQGFEGIARETSDGMTWTTFVRVVVTVGKANVWVETQADSDRLIGIHMSVGRPRVVDDLVAATNGASLGGSAVHAELLSIPASLVPVIVEHLRSETRTLPTIVVSQPDLDDGGAWLRRANRISRRVVGVATVITLDHDAVERFSNELGQLATWDGSIRVYTPVPLLEGEGYRHRYTLHSLLEDEVTERRQIDRMVYGVCSLSARRRPDTAFDVFTAAPQHNVDLSDYLSIDDAEIIIRDLQSKLDAANEDLRGANEDQELLSSELSMKVGHLSRLHQELEHRAIFDLFYESQHDPGSGMPDEADSVDSAIILAMDFLDDWLIVHDDAPQDLDGINSAPQATAWGNTTWRGFRALAAFALARGEGFGGNFYDWCRSDQSVGWPATPKKLSMTESDTVQNNSVLSGKRILPVLTDVNPTGQVLMLAHLKISEGGGRLAPRIYFYDDTAGPTKKIHVGFVGPHYLMPNTKA